MMSMTAGATTAVPRKTRLARSGTAALQHSRLGAVAYGRIYPVHVWPVLRCPPRSLEAYLNNDAPAVKRLDRYKDIVDSLWEFTTELGDLIRQQKNSIWAFIV